MSFVDGKLKYKSSSRPRSQNFYFLSIIHPTKEFISENIYVRVFNSNLPSVLPLTTRYLLATTILQIFGPYRSNTMKLSLSLLALLSMSSAVSAMSGYCYECSNGNRHKDYTRSCCGNYKIGSDGGYHCWGFPSSYKNKYEGCCKNHKKCARFY